MNKYILASVMLFSSTAFSSAADFVEPVQQGPETAFLWSGAYIGVNAGYGWGSSDFRDAEYNGGFTGFPVVNWDASSNGFMYGLQAGYNFQNDTMVIGVEGEFGYLNFKGSAIQPGLDPFGDPYDAYGTVNGGLYGAANLRLGYAADRTLFYTKVGAVYSNAEIGFIDTCTTGTCGPGTINASENVGWGYQIGGGVEHAFSENWTIKAEYTYIDFGKTKASAVVVGGGFDGLTKGADADLTAHTVKIGLNYKF